MKKILFIILYTNFVLLGKAQTVTITTRDYNDLLTYKNNYNEKEKEVIKLQKTLKKSNKIIKKQEKETLKLKNRLDKQKAKIKEIKKLEKEIKILTNKLDELEKENKENINQIKKLDEQIEIYKKANVYNHEQLEKTSILFNENKYLKYKLEEKENELFTLNAKIEKKDLLIDDLRQTDKTQLIQSQKRIIDSLTESITYLKSDIISKDDNMKKCNTTLQEYITKKLISESYKDSLAKVKSLLLHNLQSDIKNFSFVEDNAIAFEKLRYIDHKVQSANKFLINKDIKLIRSRLKEFHRLLLVKDEIYDLLKRQYNVTKTKFVLDILTNFLDSGIFSTKQRIEIQNYYDALNNYCIITNKVKQIIDKVIDYYDDIDSALSFLLQEKENLNWNIKSKSYIYINKELIKIEKKLNNSIIIHFNPINDTNCN